MGSEISSFLIEPVIGAGAVALAIMAILSQEKGKATTARWFTIGSISALVILIVLNIILTMLAG
jgi:hypothetical protein